MQTLLSIFVSGLALLKTMKELFQLFALLCQNPKALFVLCQLLRPEHILLFLLLIEQAVFFECSTPVLQVARLIGETLDLALLRLHLFFIMLLHVQQIVGGCFIVFYLEQSVERTLANAGTLQENSGKGSLRHTQGTFTAIFLQSASVRKRTFDALLQIEDYKTAADYLLDVQKHYKEQMQTQQREIQRLTYETRNLENWRTALKEDRLLDQQQKEQNVLWTQQLAQHEERFRVLTQQREQLEQLLHRFEQSKARDEDAQQRLHDRQQELQLARTAHKAVVDSSADYQHYQRADEVLKSLRHDEKTRDKLRQRQSNLRNTQATVEANVANLQGRLSEVNAARQHVVELSPLVEQQYE